jgi:hypothetical protein
MKTRKVVLEPKQLEGQVLALELVLVEELPKVYRLQRDQGQQLFFDKLTVSVEEEVGELVPLLKQEQRK